MNSYSSSVSNMFLKVSSFTENTFVLPVYFLAREIKYRSTKCFSLLNHTGNNLFSI